MDDQMNQGSMPANPAQGTDIGAQAPVFQTPSGAGGVSGAMGEMGGMMPPPSGGSMGEASGDGHPHEQILAALARIEEKLALIAAKVGA